MTIASELSLSRFAASHGVSKQAASKWKTAGYLVFRGSKVAVEASDSNLRGAGLGRFAADKRLTASPPVDAETSTETSTASETPERRQPHGAATRRQHHGGADAVTASEHALALVHSGSATLAEADRIKANALAHRAMLATRREAGELIEIEIAERVFFERARATRDSWLNWPARVGPLVAADLGIEADRVTEVLAAHVHQHLAELGEPEPEFANGAEAASGS